MAFTVTIDTNACCGAGNCVADAPSAFALDDDGIAHTLDGVRELSDDKLRVIERGCPSGAVRLA